MEQKHDGVSQHDIGTVQQWQLSRYCAWQFAPRSRLLSSKHEHTVHSKLLLLLYTDLALAKSSMLELQHKLIENGFSTFA